jgi:Uncharacterized protein conserved in bacteria
MARKAKKAPVDVKGLLLKARSQLLLDEAFFGTLALRLPLVEDPSCDTMWVDGTKIGYNPDFVLECSQEELKGTLCHEVLHVANGHCWRRGDRDEEDWNRACDYVINPILLDAGFKLPEGALVDPRFKGKSAEEVYDLIHVPKPSAQGAPQGGQGGQQFSDQSIGSPSGQSEGQDEESDQPQSSSGSEGSEAGNDPNAGPDNGQGDSDEADNTSNGGDEADGDAGDAQDGSDDSAHGDQKRSRRPAGEVRDAPKDADPKQLEREWKQAVAQAEKAASMRGNLPGSLRRMTENVLKPSIDWRAALRQFIQRSWTAADYTWQMPSLRYLAQGLYLPRLASETLPCIVIATDTSASIWIRLLAAFQAEIQAICDEIRPEETFLVYCDAKVQRVDRFVAGEPVKFCAVGGGGTDFRPAFDWVAKEGLSPACLVYLTDLDGAFPDQPPEYPVLWISPPRPRRKPPWGEHVEMRI